MGTLLALALLQNPLAADDIEVRERAARELVGLGEEALPRLRRELAEAVDTESRLRLQGVIARLETDRRRRAFGGGNEVAGLRARLVKVEDAPEGRVPYRLEIMNVDAAPRPFVPIRVWNASLPEGSRTRSSAQAGLTLKRRDPQVSGLCYGSYGCGGGPDRRSVLLQPGESRSFPLLDGEYVAPGRYELQVSYLAKRLLEAGEDLASDVVTFEIR